MAPVLLQCGHEVSAVVEIDGEPRCGACASEQTIEREVVEAAFPTTPMAEPAGFHHEIRSGVDGREQRLDGADSTPQPYFGTRGTEPGPRGCWALNAHGEPCGSFVTRDSDFCSAHRGLGLGRDPHGYSQVGHAARRRQLAARAQLRMVMGDRGRIGPRTLLREEVHRNAQRLVGRAVGAALNPETEDAKAAGIAMRLIETADPPSQATVEISGPVMLEDINRMSLSELMTLADANGIDYSRPASDEPAGDRTPPTDPSR